MKRIITTLCMAFSCSLAMAQSSVGEIDGKVTDSSGEAITGAIVRIERDGITESGVATNYDGEYSLTGLVPGNYDLVIEYPGMKAIVKEILIYPQGGIIYQDVKLQDNTGAKAVVMVYKAPTVNINKPNAKKVSAEEIEKLNNARHSYFQQLSSSSVVQKRSGGNLNIGGCYGTLYVIDGVVMTAADITKRDSLQARNNPANLLMQRGSTEPGHKIYTSDQLQAMPIRSITEVTERLGNYGLTSFR